MPIPSVATKSSTAAAKSSTLVHLATCQWTTSFSISSGASASPSAPPQSSIGPTLLKVKTTAGRGTRPSPHKKQVAFQVPSDDDEADDEELAAIIRDRQERAARAKGSYVPLMLDPKKILDFIDLWHKNPNTPLPDLNLTPGQSDMLAAFISEEKWKFEKDMCNTPDAAKENENTRAAEESPAPEDHARATINVAPQEQPRPAEASAAPEESEETEHTRATSSVMLEENEPTSSAPPAKSIRMKNINLPSASEVKKTKAAEKATEYVSPDDTDEENPSPASSEQLDEEIEVEDIPTTPPEVPATTAEEIEIQTTTEEREPSIPQTTALKILTQEVVKPSTANLQPKQQIHHAKRLMISSLSTISSLTSTHMTQHDFDVFLDS
nr:cell surface glycoprotein 1-like [Aegilops tauschii subsp. strangulata]